MSKLGAVNRWSVLSRDAERHTVHKVWHVDDARDSLGVGVGQGPRVAQLPAESVGQEDHTTDWLDALVGTSDVSWETIDDLFMTRGDHITTESARETIGAYGSLHLGALARALQLSRPGDEQQESSGCFRVRRGMLMGDEGQKTKVEHRV